MNLALPKGRLLDGVLARLAAAGYVLTAEPRSYTVTCPGIDGVLLKPRAIAQLVALGFVEAGFAGRDILLDSIYENLVELADTGLNRVRIVAAAKDPRLLEQPPARPLVVATEFAQLTDRWLTDRGLSHIVLHSGGSTEAYAGRYADLVVDVVETGETLRANGLTILHEFCESSTVLFTRQELANRDDLLALAKAVRA